MRTSIEMRQERAAVIEEAGKILVAAEGEDREMTAEELQRWEGLHADATATMVRIQRIETQETRERELADTADVRRQVTGVRDGSSEDEAENEEMRSQAYRSWLRYGPGGLTEEERAVEGILTPKQARALVECGLSIRVAQTVTTTGGGHLIPRAFQTELDVALLAFGGMRAAARIVPTSDGATLDWPTVDDTGISGRLLAINVAVTNTAITSGTVPFEAYKYSSDSILVPVELAQDSAFDLDAHINEMLATRLGRITNLHFTTGDGTAKPNGIVTAAVDSTVDFGLAAGFTYQNWLDTEHSIDPAYRVSPTCGWMMHDTTLKGAKALLDSNGRPIFRGAGDAVGQIDTLLGYPITINQDMADDTTASNKHLLFGEMKKYIVRMVRPMIMLRLEERYADAHQIGYLAFERVDGDLVDAGTAPVKYAEVVA